MTWGVGVGKKCFFLPSKNGKLVSFFISRATVSLKIHYLVGLLTNLRAGLGKSRFFMISMMNNMMKATMINIMTELEEHLR